MKYVATMLIPTRTIKVESNGAAAKANQWMRIKDAKTGEILHTGKPAYIKRLAKKRYQSLLGA